MKLRSAALPALLTVGALAAPAVAQAATLTATVSKPCYGTNDRVPLSGTGFTANGQVTLAQGQRTLSPTVPADASGNIPAIRAIVQPLTASEETAPYTATDQTNPAIVAATAPIRFSNTTIRGTKAGDSGLIQRVKARGWTTGSRTLYVHIRRNGRTLKTIRLGGLTGACRSLDVRRRFFRPSANAGLYPVFFDTYRRYKKGRTQQFRGTFTVRRRATTSTASTGTGLSQLSLARASR
jgi:hypothetical protein